MPSSAVQDKHPEDLSGKVSNSSTMVREVDELFTVVHSRAWMLVVSLFSLLGAGFIWLLFGSLPVYIESNGIIINAAGLKTVFADSDGRIETLDAKIGDTFAKGDTYGRISKIALKSEIEVLNEQIDEKKLLHLERSDLRELEINLNNSKLETLVKRSEVLKKLLEKGLVTESSYVENQEKIKQVENTIEKLEFEYISDKYEILELQRKLRSKMKLYNRETTLMVPYEGTVVEVKSSVGANVTASTPILTLESKGTENQLVAYLFVPVTDAKKIKPGMDLTVNPNFINSEQFGAIMAKVSFVSPYPISKEALKDKLQYESLINDITKDGVVVQVNAELLLDPSTVSGYRWTSKIGPPITIKSGTICTAKIVESKKRPIEIIFPEISRYLRLLND